VPDSYHIPSSLSRMREAIKVCSTPLRRRVVNGGTQEMVAKLTAADTSLLLRSSLWLRLLALSGAQFRLHGVGE
jgi:hypothetical protein